MLHIEHSPEQILESVATLIEQEHRFLGRLDQMLEQETQNIYRLLAGLMNGTIIDPEYEFWSRRVSIGCDRIVPEHNLDRVHEMFPNAQPHHMHVLRIMTGLSPNLHSEQWFDLKYISIEAELRLGDVFELAKFLPSLEKVDVLNVTLPDSVCYTLSHIDCHDFEEPDNPFADDNSVEYLDMSAYELHLRNTYEPLTNSQIDVLLINFWGVVSAQCLYATERLCNWYFPGLNRLDVGGPLHTRINGEWTCTTNSLCRFHEDLE